MLKLGILMGEMGASQVAIMVKNLPVKCRRYKRHRFNP